jgi:hypothetical protein
MGDITFRAGDRVDICVELDFDPTATAMRYRLSKNGATTIDKTLDDGIDAVTEIDGDPVDHGVCVTLTPADTAGLTGAYRHEMKAATDDDVWTVISGKVTVTTSTIRDAV